MSEAIAFDTHRFVKNLTASGFTEAQAEALAGEQAHLLDSNLATRADFEAAKADLGMAKADLEFKIEQVRSGLELKIEQVRSGLELKIEQVKSDLELKIKQVGSDLEVKIEKARSDIVKWVVGAMTAQATLIAGLVWYLLARMPGG